MLSQYIDNRVTAHEREYIEEHLSTCPDCQKKFIYLTNLIGSLQDSYKKVMEMTAKKRGNTIFSIREHEKFLENLSPYIDNELEAFKSFEFRKYLMRSKIAQKELKKVYYLQKQLYSSYENVKQSLDTDFSKIITSGMKKNYGIRRSYVKVAIITGLLLFGAVELKQFSIPIKNKIEKTLHKKKDSQYTRSSAAVSDTDPLKSALEED
jgi:hypothetical protein